MLHRLKHLLSSPEAKTSRTARVIALETGGRARWTPRDYTALAREGFSRNAVVHRAVKLVAENVAAAPFLVYEGAQARDKHPLTDLLARPNPRQDGAAFLEAVTAYLLIAGNGYLEAVTLDTVRELYALRPDRMRVVPGPDGWAQAYEYTVGGSTVRFEQSVSPPPILHLTLFNPLDDHYGLGALEAAAVAIDTHNAAAAWNKALLDNARGPPAPSSTPPGRRGAVRLPVRPLEARARRHLSGRGERRPPAAARRRLDWKAMSLTPKDMDFLEAKHAAAREIALAFGVPPMLLGIPAITPTPIIRRRTARCGARPCCRSPAASAPRSLNGWRRRSGASSSSSIPTASTRSPPTAPRCGSASPKRAS